MSLSKKIEKTEFLFFWFVIILNLIPVLSVKFFPTTDGPSHLYNSNIINQLFFYDNISIEKYFIINSEYIPNWTGHFILAFFNLFLPAFLAEKAFMILYLVLLPISFRIVLKYISPKNKIFCYLIFPFTYSYPFFLGFFNFSIALIFLFLTIAYWIKNENKITDVKKIIVIFLLISITYFSHLFVYAFLLIFISFYTAFKSISEVILQKNNFNKFLYNLLKKYMALLIASMFSLILSLLYFKARTYEKEVYIDHAQLIMWIKNIRPYLTLDPIEKPRQEILTKIIFYTIFITFLIGIYNRIKVFNFNKIYHSNSFRFLLKNIFIASDFWFFISGFLLLLIFISPDHFSGGGGYMSVRFELMFFLFLIIWMATVFKKRKILTIIIIIVLNCSFILNYSYCILAKRYNTAAIECNKASEYIKPNSIVFTLNFSKDWYLYSITDYAGVDKPMIILDNYECFSKWFPVQWNNNDTSIRKIHGNCYSSSGFPDLVKSFLMKDYKNTDYVLIFDNINIATDSFKIPLKKVT